MNPDLLPASFKNFTFDEAIQFIKAHPEIFSDSDMGLEIIRLIKQGNTRKLKRWWRGKR